MSGTVVVGIEPAAPGPGRDALALGASLARHWQAELVLVTVIDPDETGGAAGIGERLAALQAISGECSAMCGGAPVLFRVVAGTSPALALHEIAERLRALCVVVGSARCGRAGRVLPGTVAERLLPRAPCPVAVAPRGFAVAHPRGARLQRIGVGFLDTADGRAALRCAAALAARDGGRLQALTVLPSPWSVGDATTAAFEDAIAVLAVPAEQRILRGGVVDELAAASQDVDVLVVGSRGYGPLRAVLLGGVSGRVLREAHCPVIVAPARPAEQWSAANAASAAAGA